MKPVEVIVTINGKARAFKGTADAPMRALDQARDHLTVTMRATKRAHDEELRKAAASEPHADTKRTLTPEPISVRARGGAD